jgi:ABC-type sugar transport system ATPase subunit
VRRPAASPRPLFEARGLGKHFGAVVSLDGVDLVAHAGEVHALTGANGAGKSPS